MCELASVFQRRHVGDLPAFGFFRLPRGVSRRLLSEAYQSQMQFGYFRLPRGLSRRTRHCPRMAGARHGMCELTRQGNGMGTAWERHGMCKLAFSVPQTATVFQKTENFCLQIRALVVAACKLSVGESLDVNDVNYTHRTLGETLNCAFWKVKACMRVTDRR
jgi:hypothetical protein